MIVTTLLPVSAEASVFSFVSNLFSSKTVYESGTTLPSEGSPTALEPNLSPAQQPQGGAEVFIEDDSSLAPDSSPSKNENVERVSSNSGRISVYVVREGDTLSQIARMFNVTTNTIAWANDVKGGVISPGQELVILPISGVRYTVEKGDTLKSIVKEFGGDVDEVLDYNHLESGTKLAIGDVIVIPDGEIARSQQSTSGSSSPSSSTSGYFIRPTRGTKTQGIHGYNGVDIAAPAGTPIVASASGEVIISRSGGWNGGYGNYIVISHANGTQTLYSHNSSNAVGVGAYVTQGEIIGYVGSTGKSTGNHVHFEVRGATNPF